MNKYLIVTSNSTKIDVDYIIVKTEKDINHVHNYIETELINQEKCHKISCENFNSHYNNIGKSLSSTLYDYKYCVSDLTYNFYDGENSKQIQIYNLDEFNLKENYAIAVEKDVAQPYLITKDVFNKLWNNINLLLVLYADEENEEIKTIKDFCSSSYLSHPIYIPAEYLDYNDFDFIDGEIKNYERIGISPALESDLILKVVNYSGIKFI